MKVRFVTGNAGKAREAALHLARVGVEVEAVSTHVPEIQADALEEVARAKAESLRGKVAPPFFVEDAGLFTAAFAGFPGVYTAYVNRTLGVEGLLRALAKSANRVAVFRAVVAAVDLSGECHLFRGQVDGTISRAAAGSHGFGYDPIFIPAGESRTFAEFSEREKSQVSHRGRALDALAAFLTGKA